MANINKELNRILSTEVFQKIINNDIIRIRQLNAAISLLIKTGIPFDITFSPGTRRDAAAAELSIFVAPTTTITFLITFEGGGTVFGET
ncbi:hypothetical protein [Thermohalobacter berrensis]|uniref:Uncharacterized protein n=1 Tax=Thermohalobacter berrensis TaxID=99594 RepID=A0A419TAT8_9FIRM|nr:hypothetical protein [Thermohalobacter berrensis]RKD34599.1 hypothetical protein BET03_01880 [Thermohalobacter berrensis]